MTFFLVESRSWRDRNLKFGQVSVQKSEGWVKIYNVKMVNTEMARGPPKHCRNQKILLDSFKLTPRLMLGRLDFFIFEKSVFSITYRQQISTKFSVRHQCNYIIIIMMDTGLLLKMTTPLMLECNWGVKLDWFWKPCNEFDCIVLCEMSDVILASVVPLKIKLLRRQYVHSTRGTLASAQF